MSGQSVVVSNDSSPVVVSTEQTLSELISPLPKLPASQVLKTLRTQGEIKINDLIDLYLQQTVSLVDLVSSVYTFVKERGYKPIETAIALGVELVQLSAGKEAENQECCEYLIKLFSRPEVSNLACFDLVERLRSSEILQSFCESRFDERLKQRLQLEEELSGYLYDSSRSKSLSLRGNLELSRVDFSPYIFKGKCEEAPHLSWLFSIPEQKHFHDLLCSSANCLDHGPTDYLPGCTGCVSIYEMNGDSISVLYLQSGFKDTGPVPVQRDLLRRYRNFRQTLVEATASYAHSLDSDLVVLRLGAKGDPASNLRTRKELLKLTEFGLAVVDKSEPIQEFNAEEIFGDFPARIMLPDLTFD